MGAAHWASTRNVKLPSILWVSVDTARQFTLYSPAFKGLRLIRIVLSLTCALPWLTKEPLASSTVRFENAASSLSVNVSMTSCGAALVVEPTDGLRVQEWHARARPLHC